MRIENVIRKLRIFYIHSTNASFFTRVTRHERIERECAEEEKRKQKPTPATSPSPPVVGSPDLWSPSTSPSGTSDFGTPSSSLTPQSLTYPTPTTPEVPQPGGSHGRPCKALVPLTFDDCPDNATKAEKLQSGWPWHRENMEFGC